MAENTFSSSGEDAITRAVDLATVYQTEDIPLEKLPDFYDIARTADEINKGDYKRIALQFPDELLHDSVPIYRILKSRLGPDRELYVLADTSYGSCCVDEVAAQHIDADAIVHYGHACMSQTSRLPVIYVFGKKYIDVAHCVESFATATSSSETSLENRTVVLRYDSAYAHLAVTIVETLQETFPPSVRVFHSPVPLISYPRLASSSSSSSTLPTPPSEPTPNALSEDPSSHTSEEDCTFLYVGGECLSLTNLLMTHASAQIYSYDPQSKQTRLESGRTNKLLMRRYAVVQKARDADVFGILIGTLGVASYLPLISHLRSILTRARKKSYTISVGKLSPNKLANFLEIECFVLVACPENSLIEAKEFLRPIITPFELEIALRTEQSWTGRYVLDFEKVIAEHEDRKRDEASTHGDEDDEDPDQPIFSLVTGKYRHAKRYEDPSTIENEQGPTAVILRSQDNTVARLTDSAAGISLQDREYQGLEARVGQDAPSVLEQGRTGIARGYEEC